MLLALLAWTSIASLAGDRVAAGDPPCRIRETGGRLFLDAPRSGALPPGDLTITSRDTAEATGTTHSAAGTTISIGKLKPIQFGGDDPEFEREGLSIASPFFDRQFKLDASLYLVLAWSSRGSGMQAQHAYLVARDDRSLTIADQLIFESSRMEGMFLVRSAGGKTSIGVITPGRDYRNAEGDVVGERWSLVVGGDSPDLERLRATDSFELAPGPCDFVIYAPPFQRHENVALGDHRVAWIDVEGQRFARRRGTAP